MKTFKTIITLILGFGILAIQKFRAPFEAGMATNQVEDDNVAYATSQFLSNDFAQMIIVLLIIIVFVIWFSDIRKLGKKLVEKLKEG